MDSGVYIDNKHVVVEVGAKTNWRPGSDFYLIRLIIVFIRIINKCQSQQVKSVNRHIKLL